MKQAGVVLVSGVFLFGTFIAMGQEQPREQERTSAIVHDGKTLDKWIEVLKSDDEEARSQAARALVDIGPPAYPALSRALSNPYEPIWKHTVEALVKLGEPAVPALLAAIYMEQSGDLRHNGGVAAIQQMGAKAHPALKRALTDDEEMVRFAAITALRMQVMGPASEATIKILDGVLQSHKDVAIRTHAAEALGYVGLALVAPRETEHAANALIRALKDSSDDVKGMAAVSLVRLDTWRGQDVVPFLITALKSDEEMLPYFAVEALRQLGPAAEPAIPALIETIRQDRPFIADQAAEALGKIGPAAVPSLRELLNNSTGTVRAHAAEALGSAGAGVEDTVPELLESLKQDDPSVRAAAARALGEARADSDEAITALTKALADENRDVRNAAIHALGRIGSKAKPAVPALAKLLGELEYFEQDAVMRALGGIGPGAKEAIPAMEAALADGGIEAGKNLARIGPAAVPSLIKALGSEDPDVRQAAAWGLRYLGPDARKAVPTLAELVKKDEKACNFALQALGAIGPNAEPAVPAIVARLRDGDKQVRYWALHTLREIGPGARAAKAAVLAAMETDDQERRWEAATALIAMGEVDDGLPVVLNALEEDNAYYSIGAIEMLIETGPAASAAAPTLTKIMKDGEAEPHLRMTCAKALVTISPNDGAGIKFLRDEVSKPDGQLALPAAFTLVELGKADDAVVAALKPGLTSEHPGMFIACAGALAKVKKEREAATEMLRRKLQEKDKQVRVATALALTEAGIVVPEAIRVLAAQLRLQDGSGRKVDAVRALGIVAGKDTRAKAILTEALHHETDAVREAARKALSRKDH